MIRRVRIFVNRYAKRNIPPRDTDPSVVIRCCQEDTRLSLSISLPNRLLRVTRLVSLSQPSYTPPRSKQGRFQVWYRSAVVMLAVLIVGLPWCRTGKSGYVADGTATIVSDSQESEAHAHLQPLVEEILQATTTDKQLTAYLADDIKLQNELGTSDPQRALEMLRRRLTVTPNRVGGKISLQLSFYGDSRDSSSQLLQRILHDFKTEFQTWQQEKIEGIEATYVDQLRSTKQQLADLDAQLYALKSKGPAEPRKLQPIVPQRKRNPKWVAASQELATSQATLRTLLETRTPKHPVVVDQHRKVQLAEEQLASLPEYEKETPPPTLEPTSPEEDRQNQIATLQQQRQEAESVLANIQVRQEDAEKALGFIHGITMTIPADVHVAALGGVWRSTALLVLGGWAIFAGLIAYQLASGAASPRMIHTVSKLSAASPIPVTASVTVGGDWEESPQPGWNWGAASYLLSRAAELAIVSLIGLIVLAVLTQPQFSQQLMEDPLGAVRELLRNFAP